jgi:hypothetical protein
VFLEAGVRAGEIRKSNKMFSNSWCIHGDCDTVGLGFLISGGQFSGIEGGWTGVCGTASDYIRTINYVDSIGTYRSATDYNSSSFKALRMIGGEFGVITSLEVQLIRPSPKYTWYVVNYDKELAKTLFKKLMNHHTFKDDTINIQFCLYGPLFIVVIYYDPNRWNGDFEETLVNDFNLSVHHYTSKVVQCLSGSNSYQHARTIDWGIYAWPFQKRLNVSPWTESHYGFLL